MHSPTSQTIQYNTRLLIQASKNGDVDTVKRLVDASHLIDEFSFALQWAATLGHVECVTLLLPLVEPTVNHNRTLQLASKNGHTECVKLLIPVSDPKTNKSFALRTAALNGHADIVKLLIPVSDPKANDSLALLWAIGKEHTDIVKLLIPVSDYSIALSILKNEGNDTTLLQRCIEEHEALLQQKRLKQEIDSVLPKPKKSHIRKI